jgi:hypothetical protein
LPSRLEARPRAAKGRGLGQDLDRTADLRIQSLSRKALYYGIDGGEAFFFHQRGNIIR